MNWIDFEDSTIGAEPFYGQEAIATQMAGIVLSANLLTGRLLSQQLLLVRFKREQKVETSSHPPKKCLLDSHLFYFSDFVKGLWSFVLFVVGSINFVSTVCVHSFLDLYL